MRRPDLIDSHISLRERVRKLEIMPQDAAKVVQEPWTPSDTRTDLLANLLYGLSLMAQTSGTFARSEHLMISGPAAIIRDAMWRVGEWGVVPDPANREKLVPQVLGLPFQKALGYEFTRLLQVIGGYPAQTASLGATGKDYYFIRAADDGRLRTVFGGETEDGYQLNPRASHRIIEWEIFHGGSLKTFNRYDGSEATELFPWEDFRSPGTGWPTYGHLGDATRWRTFNSDPEVKSGDAVNSWFVQRTKQANGAFTERHYAGIITAAYDTAPGDGEPGPYAACYSGNPDIQPNVDDFKIGGGTAPNGYKERIVDRNVPCPNDPVGDNPDIGGILYEARAYSMDSLFFKHPPSHFVGTMVESPPGSGTFIHISDQTNFNRIRDDFGGVMTAPTKDPNDERYMIRAVAERVSWALAGNAKIGEVFDFPLVQWFIQRWESWLGDYLRLSKETGGWQPLDFKKDLIGRVDFRITNGQLHLRGHLKDPSGAPYTSFSPLTLGFLMRLPSSITTYPRANLSDSDAIVARYNNGEPVRLSVDTYQAASGTPRWNVLSVTGPITGRETNHIVFDGVNFPIHLP